MKITLTAKLKLLSTPGQFRALRATQLAYRHALNCVSPCSFAHRKTSSGKRLQQATYADLRSQFGLPSQMACNVPRQVGATRHRPVDQSQEECRSPSPGLHQTARREPGQGPS